MSIEVSLLEEVITKMVNMIKGQLEGDIQPSMSKYEAIKELGVISALVIGLYDKLEDDSLKEKVWGLKEEADTMIQNLFGF